MKQSQTVAVVVADPGDAVAYLEMGGVTEYVIVRTAADVPESLGGMAILRQDELDPELRDALTCALLGALA